MRPVSPGPSPAGSAGNEPALGPVNTLAAGVSMAFFLGIASLEASFSHITSSILHQSSTLTVQSTWYIFYTMEFEFDPGKSLSNKVKHGIDFQEAQSLWDDPDLLEIPAKTTDESRFVVIGRIKGRHWSSVIKYRQENVRIISVRRSRQEEIELYEGS
jgi:uncharacterized protein